MKQAVESQPDNLVTLDGTITALERMPRSESSRVTLNRRWTVIVSSGISDLFSGMRVRVQGVWHEGARRRYLLASQLEPMDPTPSMPVERLSRALLGTVTPSEEQRQVLELLSPALNWLLSAGSKAVAKRLAQLELRKAQQIAGNPFSLVKRRLLNFDAAEMLHRQLQTDPWHLGRLQAGTTEVLRRAEKSGRARITRAELIERVTALLALSDAFEVEWEAVWRSSIVARDGEHYCLPSWYHQRRQALQMLRVNQLAMTLSVPEGYAELLRHRYSVVTGAAMSGKTTLVRNLASAYRDAGWRVAVTAMTGKAASVLGEDAQTLHRLIGYGPLGCRKDPLALDLLVIDEVSMLTWPVLASVLRVMRGQILFVGDPRQLPPVEGEPVHRELLSMLPVLDLGVRQTGQVEVVRHWSEAHLLSNLERLVRRCHEERRDWQVLSPVKRSELGTHALNQFLQRVVNPEGAMIGGGYRVGDRVMVIRNDYEGMCPIYNGQVGRVCGGETSTVAVQLDGGRLYRWQCAIWNWRIVSPSIRRKGVDTIRWCLWSLPSRPTLRAMNICNTWDSRVAGRRRCAMRSRRFIRLASRHVRTVFRVPPSAVKKRAAGPRVSVETWEQIDRLRQTVSASAPWLQVPGVHIRLTGQLPSGKNRQGIRTELEPAMTTEGRVVSLPRVLKHPRQRFVEWREASLKELSPQLRQWSRILPLAVPMLMYVWYWPSDRRIRDRSGMMDALFHVLERAGVVADDGLVEDPIWRTMELDRQSPRVELVLRPFVSLSPGSDGDVWTSVAGCPCCALPLVS